ncbi:MAG: efflux RND transporter permease subunit [bacterium]
MEENKYNFPQSNQSEEANTYDQNYIKILDQAYEKEKKSFFGFFIRNWRITYLLILIIIIFGLFSVLTLPREAEPEIKVPYALVSTAYMGATPTDVEELITNEIEEKIEGLDGLNRFTSSSGLGFSSIFVEFEAEADLKESMRKLRDAVDSVKPSLPSEAESPVVTEIRMNDFPIVTYSLIGNYDDKELKLMADMVQGELERITDVSNVQMAGGQTREFQVIVDPAKLAHFNISLSQIISAIQSTNFNLPAGEIEIDSLRYGVRVEGRISEAVELNNIVVATYNDSPVFLNDVAIIQDGFKKKTSQSQIGFAGEEPQNAISLIIYKKTGGNIIKMTEEAEIKIAELQNVLPADLIIKKTNDNSQYVKDDLRTLGTSAIQTFILITIILLLILSFRGAIITALAVPMAFLTSFMFLKLYGMTLNSMVLFSLVLSLGLMVDNAIIIIEGINEYFEKYKLSIKKSAILSVWNFKKAITSGTMTTVSAFLPLLLVSGIMGEYMGIIPKTLTITLVSSLFVALIIMPTIVSRMIKADPNNQTEHRTRKRHLVISGWMKKLHVHYINFLENVLPNKKKRRKIIITAWIFFILSIAVPITGLMKIEMFPKIDFNYFTISIELPVGSSLDKTILVTKDTEKIVRQIPEVDNYVTNMGSSAAGWGEGFGYSGGSASLHRANITVNLVEQDQRERKSFEIAESIREEVENIPGAEISVSELVAGPPSGSPVEVRIFGTDAGQLAVLSKEIKDYFAKIDGIVNIEDSIEDSTGEFTFTINKQQASYYGLSSFQIASTLRNAVYGSKASVVNLEGDDIDITVKYSENSLTNITDLENILIHTPRGDSVMLGQVASLKLVPSMTALSHRDGKQLVTITADVEEGVNIPNVMSDFNEYKDSLDLPNNFSIDVGGETEEIEKSFTEIFYSMIVAVLLIIFILILQFNSFKQPLIIMFSLPLSIIGVIIGLNLFRQPFSITAFIGVVSLAGIVVNDAIVLVDRINKNIANGMKFYRSIIDGGVARMQPIFLTSLTTIAGIFPLLYANEMWRGLSLSVIFGLLFSTVLNLIFVPIMYASWCRKDYLKGDLKKNGWSK